MSTLKSAVSYFGVKDFDESGTCSDGYVHFFKIHEIVTKLEIDSEGDQKPLWRSFHVCSGTTVNEDELDSLLKARPYGTADAQHAEQQILRCAALGAALWGGDAGGLQRQLLASHPVIPQGFSLDEYRELHRLALMLVEALRQPGRAKAWGLPTWVDQPAVFVGNQEFTIWEARAEVVRRAIEFLVNRR